MTLDEMIDKLQKLSDDGYGEALMVMSIDSEGNDYNELDLKYCLSYDVVYSKDYHEVRSVDDFDDGETPEMFGVPAVVIYP